MKTAANIDVPFKPSQIFYTIILHIISYTLLENTNIRFSTGKNFTIVTMI